MFFLYIQMIPEIPIAGRVKRANKEMYGFPSVNKPTSFARDLITELSSIRNVLQIILKNAKASDGNWKHFIS